MLPCADINISFLTKWAFLSHVTYSVMQFFTYCNFSLKDIEKKILLMLLFQSLHLCMQNMYTYSPVITWQITWKVISDDLRETKKKRIYILKLSSYKSWNLHIFYLKICYCWFFFQVLAANLISGREMGH